MFLREMPMKCGQKEGRIPRPRRLGHPPLGKGGEKGDGFYNGNTVFVHCRKNDTVHR